MLREVAVRLRLAQEAVIYSLELSILPGVMTQAAALSLCRYVVLVASTRVSPVCLLPAFNKPCFECQGQSRACIGVQGVARKLVLGC